MTDAYAAAFDPMHGVLMGKDWDGRVQKWTHWHSEGNGNPKNFAAWRRQDDIKIISGRIKGKIGGDGFRPDKEGGQTIALGQPNAFTPLSASGVIERPNDFDYYSFTVPSGGGNYSILV